MAALARAVDTWAARVFTRAITEFERDVRNDRRTPFDTGALSRGLRVTRSGDTSGEIRSTTTNAGFDYPEHLNRAARIAPSRAKYLRFEVGGRTVYSRGFDNRHQGWWDDVVTDARWRDAVADAAKGVRFG